MVADIDVDQPFWADAKPEHIQDQDAIVDDEADEEDGERPQGKKRPMWVPHLFERSLWIPGTMHIVHTIAGDVVECLANYEKEYLPLLRAMTSFLSAPWLLERFVNQCLLPKGGEMYECFFINVDCNFAEWRWGSLMNTLSIIVGRMGPLRVFWKASKLIIRRLKHWLVAPVTDTTAEGTAITDVGDHKGLDHNYGYDLQMADEELEDHFCFVVVECILCFVNCLKCLHRSTGRHCYNLYTMRH